MDDCWSRLISRLSCSRRCAYGLFFLFYKIERVFKCDFYFSCALRLVFDVIYVYKTNQFQLLKFFTDKFLMINQLQSHDISYAKLNELLSNKKYNNQDLYEYLHSFKNQRGFDQNDGKQFSGVSSTKDHQFKWSVDIFKNIEFPLKDQEHFREGSQKEILKQTEQLIFTEALALTSEITQLQAQLFKFNGQNQKLKKKLVDLQDHFDNQLCQNAQRQMALTISDTTIKQISNETRQIIQKIKLTSMLDYDMDALIRKNQEKEAQMKKQIDQLSSSKSLLISSQAESQLRMETEALKSKLAQLKNTEIKGNKKKISDNKQELLTCLNQRKFLQSEILNQQVQKSQFFQLLTNFKTNFIKTKEKNKRLKQELRKKEFKIPTISQRSENKFQ